MFSCRGAMSVRRQERRSDGIPLTCAKRLNYNSTVILHPLPPIDPVDCGLTMTDRGGSRAGSFILLHPASPRVVNDLRPRIDVSHPNSFDQVISAPRVVMGTNWIVFDLDVLPTWRRGGIVISLRPLTSSRRQWMKTELTRTSSLCALTLCIEPSASSTSLRPWSFDSYIR